MLLLRQDAPGELWELLELEKLNLSLNNLKALPPQLGLLSNLLVLNLWGNQVSPITTLHLLQHASVRTGPDAVPSTAQQPAARDRPAEETPGSVRLHKQTDGGS